MIAENLARVFQCKALSESQLQYTYLVTVPSCSCHLIQNHHLDQCSRTVNQIYRTVMNLTHSLDLEQYELEHLYKEIRAHCCGILHGHDQTIQLLQDYK